MDASAQASRSPDPRDPGAAHQDPARPGRATAPGGGSYRIAGRGSDLGIDVSGPTAEACLKAAVAGFAAALAEVEPTVERTRRPVSVVGDAHTDLLVGLVDEAILRLDADGELAVGLTDVDISGDGLHAVLEVVDLAAARVHGAAPKAATWHDARLEPAGDHWDGHVMLDL